MFDAVVGIGGETALEKYIVAVGECLFCAETEFAFPEWGGEQQFGGIEVVAYAVARSGVFGSVVFGILTDAVPAVQVVGVEVDVPFAESAVVVSVGCLPPAGVGICLRRACRWSTSLPSCRMRVVPSLVVCALPMFVPGM